MHKYFTICIIQITLKMVHSQKKNNMKLSQYDTLHIIFMSYSKQIMIYYCSEKLSAPDCIT